MAGDEEIRPDLAEVLERRAALTDDARPEAVAKRHEAGRRTARENLDDLSTPAASSSTAASRSPPSAGAASSRS